MTRSLSILLPVHNAQSHLEQLIDSLLEVLPELTSDFEVLIVDNGSTDDTSDTAQHLEARYPQIEAIRNEAQLSGEAALRPALAIARGDIIFLREEGTELEIRDIGKLWARMNRRQLVIARPSASAASGHLNASLGSTAISSWEQSVLDSIRPVAASRGSANLPGFKMLLRSVANESSWWISGSLSLADDMRDRGYSCEEIALRTEGGLCSDLGSDLASGLHRGDQPSPRRRRPNYLARILAITSGN